MNFSSRKTCLLMFAMILSQLSHTYGAAAITSGFESFFVGEYNAAADIALIDKHQSKQLEKEKSSIHSMRFAKQLVNQRDSIAHSLEVRKGIFGEHQKAYRRLVIWEIEKRIKEVLRLDE